MGFIIQLSIQMTSGLRREVISKQRVKEDFNPGTTRCSQITVETSTIQRLSFRQQSVTRQIPITEGDIIKTISTLVIQAMETAARINLPISSTAILSNLMTEVTPTFNQWPATNWMMGQQNFHGCKTTLAAKIGTPHWVRAFIQLQAIPVTLFYKDFNIETYALLVSGSDNTEITQNIADTLRIRVPKDIELPLA